MLNAYCHRSTPATVRDIRACKRNQYPSVPGAVGGFELFVYWTATSRPYVGCMLHWPFLMQLAADVLKALSATSSTFEVIRILLTYMNTEFHFKLLLNVFLASRTISNSLTSRILIQKAAAEQLALFWLSHQDNFQGLPSRFIRIITKKISKPVNMMKLQKDISNYLEIFSSENVNNIRKLWEPVSSPPSRSCLVITLQKLWQLLFPLL